MFARAGVTLSNSTHPRIRTVCASPVVWREYVSLSSCGNCQLLRSKPSSRRGFRPTYAYHKKRYSASSTSSQVSYANSRRNYEQWREKADSRLAPSMESVHTEMIQVLTCKMERMILDQSQSYLPLTVHSANSQSTSEEQWTDFDAISVISTADTSVRPSHDPANMNISVPTTSWDVELLQFKHSLLRTKKKLKLSSNSKGGMYALSGTAARLDRSSPHHDSSQTFIPKEEIRHQDELHALQKRQATQGQTLDKIYVSKSLSEPSLRTAGGTANTPEDIGSGNLLKHLHTGNAHEKKLQKLPANVAKHNTDASVHSLQFKEDSYLKDSVNVEESAMLPRADGDVSSQEITSADDLIVGIERDYAVDAQLERIEESVLQEDLETESVQSAPPVFLSKKKKASLAKQEAKQKGSGKQVQNSTSVKPLDVEKKIAFFNQDLLAYVEVCVQAGMVSNAQVAVNYYRYNGTRQKQRHMETKNVDTSHLKIQDIKIYNTLMHAWAKQEKLDMIKQCFSNMKEDGLTADLQSYAACLECLGRQRNPDLSLLERIVEDLKRDNLDICEMFNECVFAKDERQVVYQAIRQVLPDYEPNEPREVNPYDNYLLEAWKHSPAEQVVEKNPYIGVLSAEQLKSRAEEQMDLEIANDVKVKSVVRREPVNERTLKMREVLQAMEEDWRAQIKQGLWRKMKYMQRKNKGDHGMNLYPFLKLVDMDDYVNLIMKEIHLLSTESEHFSPTSSYLWRRLGYRVQQKSLIQQKVRNKITKKTVSLYKRYSEHYANEELGADNHRLCWQSLSNQATVGPTLDQPEKSWPYHYVKGLGKLLYDIILYDVKFDGNILKSTEDRRKIPSFYSIYRNYGHTTKEEIKPHPTLVKVYQGSELEDLTFETKELPMVVPPLPWISAQSGGYLLSSAQLVRLPDQAQGQKNLMGKVAPEKLYPVLDALNTLSACAWKINKPMLDLIVDVFNNKGNKDLDIPPPVSEAPPIPRLSKTMSSEERSKVYAERLRVKQQRSEMYSLWCNELYRLSIANKFRDEIFWFPHNLDFRGRTYPCPPHFNHLGSDVVRSILLFARGKPLGEKGLDWLKIHLVNLTGFKKRSPNSERLEFANSVMASIMDSADKPLTGEKWWQTSDEPWQTLACCMEIAKAVRSGNPAQFTSNFPVHQDGSCNGLQHYAALGRDQAGAESVNLHPFEQPKDVYSDVAVLVEREREKDAKEGLEVAQVLDGFVRRKVIKQTVMTTVYGVTRYGAKYQILRQLKDIPDFPQDFAWPASMYLTEKTFFCLQEMFSATKEIQDWLTVSAHLISTVSGKPVEWVTPLGFPIVQPYHRATLSNRHGTRVTDTTSIFEKPNAVKQKNAFPPNFIHSLDSTHMMLTAIYCLKAGITYVSVHDCFWTHPCDVEVMNKITREQFVALHEQPILEELSEYLVEKFGSSVDSTSSQTPGDADSRRFLDSILRRVPKKGDFDLNNVLKSTYFFS